MKKSELKKAIGDIAAHSMQVEGEMHVRIGGKDIELELDNVLTVSRGVLAFVYELVDEPAESHADARRNLMGMIYAVAESISFDHDIAEGPEAGEEDDEE